MDGIRENNDLFEKILLKEDCVKEESLQKFLHEHVLHPLLPQKSSVQSPFSKSSVSSVRGVNTQHKDDAWKIQHSSNMSQPILLDASHWGSCVLQNPNQYRLGSKHNGVRIWLVFSNMEKSQTGMYQQDLVASNRTFELNSNRVAITLLFNRAGDVWVLDSNDFESTPKKFWIFPMLIEGEMMKSSSVQTLENVALFANIHFVAFDCICVGGNNRIVMSMDLDKRGQGLGKLASAIVWKNVVVQSKHWWKLSDFFKQFREVEMNFELSRGEDYISGRNAKNFGEETLPIDGWVISHVDLKPFNLSSQSSLSQNMIFKYKLKHTIDMWVMDLGSCMEHEERMFIVRSDDNTSETEFLSKEGSGGGGNTLLRHNSKFVSCIDIDPGIENTLSLNASREKFVKSTWNYRFSTVSGSQSEFVLYIGSDSCFDSSMNGTSSDMRRWLCSNTSDRSCWKYDDTSSTTRQGSRNVLVKKVLVEFEVVAEGFGTGAGQFVFNLIPQRVRNDKLHANSSRVIANTCNFVSTTYLGGGSSNMLTPLIMIETINHVTRQGIINN